MAFFDIGAHGMIIYQDQVFVLVKLQLLWYIGLVHVVNIKSLRIGKKLVDFGEVLSITAIEEKKSLGKEARILKLRPYFKTNSNKTLIYSVPVKNLRNGRIRSPLSKEKFDKILADELVNGTLDDPINKTLAKEILKTKSPRKAIRIAKCMYQEQFAEETFTKGKKDILQMCLDCLTQEYALINKVTLEQAEEDILKTMKKHLEKKTKKGS